MSRREAKRLHIIHQVLEGKIIRRDAAGLIGLSDRQIRKMIRRIREDGDEGICNRSQGKGSNHWIPRKVKERALTPRRESSIVKSAALVNRSYQLPEAPPPPDDPPPPEKPPPPELQPPPLPPPKPPDMNVNPPMEARPLARRSAPAFLYQSLFLSMSLAMGKPTR